MKKKYFFVVLTALVTMIIVSCKTDNNEGLTPDNLLLVSPYGKIIAKSETELINILVNNSNNVSRNDKIKIKNIRYEENDKFSIGIVNFDVNSENKSLLIPIEISDNIVILLDDENIYFEEVTEKNTSLINGKNIISSNTMKRFQASLPPPPLPLVVAYVCNGGCCGWSNLGLGHYNCGCNQASIILTTSDGCGIEVIDM